MKEEIKSRLAVEDVVGQYIELKRAGRTLKGRSPWGVDKTPSFMVSPEKGIWHDFSANKGGDIFSFVMAVEGISFREALEKLATQAGVELKKYAGGDRQVGQKKARMRECLEWACKYFQVCLAKNRQVCEYVFYKRNINRATAVEFRLGYAPSGKNFLVDFLKKKGFTISEMADAGLLNRFNGDLFKRRMMVPFIDGGVIGFTGRILDQGEPKYLNTPETLLFNKSRFIFGLVQAKPAILQNGFVVIVEGNMDVISSHQAGVKEAVATSGTAMTEMHLKILSRLTNDIRLAYDGDAAGVKAAERAIMMASKLKINLSVISDYHGAKDPDELIQKDPKLWQKAVVEKTPAMDWLLKKYEEELDLMTGPGKREYSDIAMKMINMIDDAVERKHYEQMVARKLSVTVEDLKSKKLESETKRFKLVKTDSKNDGIKVLMDNLEAILLYGEVSKEGIELEMPEDRARLDELEMIFREKYGNWSNEMLNQELKELWKRYRKELNRQRIEKLSLEMENLSDDDARMEEILREITILRREN